MAQSHLKAVGEILAKHGILVAFVLFMIAFAMLNPRFINSDNLLGVVRSSRHSWRDGHWRHLRGGQRQS